MVFAIRDEVGELLTEEGVCALYPDPQCFVRTLGELIDAMMSAEMLGLRRAQSGSAWPSSKDRIVTWVSKRSLGPARSWNSTGVPAVL